MFEKYISQEGAQIRKRGTALIGQKTGVGDQWESSSNRTAAPFFPPLLSFQKKTKNMMTFKAYSLSSSHRKVMVLIIIVWDNKEKWGDLAQILGVGNHHQLPPGRRLKMCYHHFRVSFARIIVIVILF